MPSTHSHSIGIACGGTGGHLFPGLAIAEKLVERQSDVTLIISRKEVDQQAIRNAGSFKVLTLPAVGLQGRNMIAFLRGFRESYVLAKRHFQSRPPHAVIAMGGFTSAAPILAGKAVGARTFLHESNTIPGRANRWLSRKVDHAFVGFPSAATRLPSCPVTVCGTPVRPQFCPQDASSCRQALGLDPARPVVLVVGGSQGASGINQMVARSLPLFSKLNPEWQWFHLTGPNDTSLMQAAYDKFGVRALVHPFFSRMELALGAASAAISRAGASSLAELCAMSVPSLLIPYPAATNNHQSHNAGAYAVTGAACVLEEKEAAPERVAGLVRELVQNQVVRQTMKSALGQWERPFAADQIARHIFGAIDAAERHSLVRSGRSQSVPGISFEATARTSSPSVTQPNPARSRQEQPASI